MQEEEKTGLEASDEKPTKWSLQPHKWEGMKVEG